MRRRMGAITLGDPRLNHHPTTTASKDHRHHLQHNHGPVVEEIEGLIRVYKDGHVERPPIVKEVPCTWSLDPSVACGDVVIDHPTRLWARLYVPIRHPSKVPLLIYFHGGGFCVGSAAWSVYHEFLSRLSARATCAVASINYRLAPECRLPAAFDDGVRAVKWALRQGGCDADSSFSGWWSARCDFSRVFLAGDSAGATIAHHVATQLGSGAVAPPLKGVILIQPFFGGEARTPSEKGLLQPPTSALTLAVSDTYWRLALPAGTTRDHPWCNPQASSRQLEGVARLPPVMVCIAEMDILRDRSAEFCGALRRAGRRVEQVVHAGVGHAFQVLSSSRAAQGRAQEMMAQIDTFINR